MQIYNYIRSKTFLLAYFTTAIILILVFGFTYGTMFTFGFGIALAMLHMIEIKYNASRGKNWLIIHHVMIGTMLLFCVSFVIVEALIATEWHSTSSKTDIDYVIILGAGLEGDKISKRLLNRLETGYEYLKEDKHLKVIVSGGQGKDETISEAEAMGKYLIQKGIGSERIIYEEKSTSTVENIDFSKKIAYSLSEGTIPKVLVITSDYHMFRTKLICKKYDLQYCGIASNNALFVRINYSIREYFATLKDWLYLRYFNVS